MQSIFAFPLSLIYIYLYAYVVKVWYRRMCIRFVTCEFLTLQYKDAGIVWWVQQRATKIIRDCCTWCAGRDFLQSAEERATRRSFYSPHPHHGSRARPFSVVYRDRKSGNRHKSDIGKYWLNIRKIFFTVRVVKLWNRCPKRVGNLHPPERAWIWLYKAPRSLLLVGYWAKQRPLLI